MYTNDDGVFRLDTSSPGLLAFPPGSVDNLSGASVKFWLTAPVSPELNVTVNPVSSLVEAYRRHQCASGTACKEIGDLAAYDDVYGLFGFHPQPGVNFVNWNGIVMGTKYGVSVYVLTQRVASVLTAASEVAAQLCGAAFTSSDNVNVQLAAQHALVEVLASKATPAERIAALSNPDDIATVLQRTLANLAAPEADVQGCATISDGDRALLFPVLAKVRCLQQGAGDRPRIVCSRRVRGLPGRSWGRPRCCVTHAGPVAQCDAPGPPFAAPLPPPHRALPTSTAPSASSPAAPPLLTRSS